MNYMNKLYIGEVLPIKMIKLGLVLGLVFTAQVIFAQGFKIEDFSEPVYIIPVVGNDILGNSLDGNMLTYKYIESIPVGTGRWFATSQNDTSVFRWKEGIGVDGDGALVNDNESQGGVQVVYVFNNSDRALEGDVFDFSGKYYFDANIDDRLAYAYYTIDIADPTDQDLFFYQMRSTGSGASADNVVRNTFNSANQPIGRELFVNNMDGAVGQGWTDLQAGTSGYLGDWCIVSISFALDKSYAGQFTDVQRLDDIAIPFGDGDDIAPKIDSLVDVSGDFGVFADEMGVLHAVPTGTEVTKAAIEAASLIQDTTYYALPLIGTVLPADAFTDGKYELYVIDQYGNISAGKHINIGTDVYDPVITSVPSGTSVYAGFDNLTAIVDEASTLKLVADGAGASGTALVEVEASEKTAAELAIPAGVSPGQYDLIAIDAAGNASVAIDVTVEMPDVTAPVLTLTGKTEELVATDTIVYTSDEPATLIYIAPEGTAEDLASVKAVAVDSVKETTTSGKIAAVNLTQGAYQLYAMDRFGNFGSSPQVVTALDLQGPVSVAAITSGTLDKGFPIAVTLNENATVYVVDAGTAVGDVTTSAIVSDTALANVELAIATNIEGFVEGNSYDVYAVDARENWSEILTTVTFTAAEEETVLSTGNLRASVYPNPASEKILVDMDNVQEVKLFDLGGKMLLSSKENFLNVSALKEGMYILRVKADDHFQTSRVSVKRSIK